MPYNTQDPFLQSGGDINVLLSMIQKLRLEVLSLNKYRPDNQSSLLDTDVLKRFVELRILAFAFRSTGQLKMAISDVQLKSQHLTSAFNSLAIANNSKAATDSATKETADVKTEVFYHNLAVQTASKEAIDLNKDIHTQNSSAEIPAPKQEVPADIRKKMRDNIDLHFNVVSDAVYHDVNDNKKVEGTSDYSFSTQEADPSYYGHTDPLTLAENAKFEIENLKKGADGGYVTPQGSSGIVIGDRDFPNHGQPWDNKTAAITEHMNNTIFFSTIPNPDNTYETAANYFKGWGIKNKDGKMVPWVKRTNTEKTPFSDTINEEIAAAFGSNSSISPAGSYKFFIEKLHGRYSDGTPYRKNKIKSQKDVLGATNLSNRMVFAAYIDNFNDNFSRSEGGAYNFIGRGEEVSIYKSTARELTLTFHITADYSLDLLLAMKRLDDQLKTSIVNQDQIKALQDSFPDWGLGHLGLPQFGPNGRQGSHIPGLYSDTPESLWFKLNFLSQCMYPYYRGDGKMKEQPMVRLRIADFYDLTGYFKSYAIDMNEFDNLMDLNPSAIGHIPFGVKVTLNMHIIHEDEPSSEYFGFYHRREFDEGTMKNTTGDGIKKMGKDTTTRTNSPLVTLPPSFSDKDIPAELSKLSNNLPPEVSQHVQMFQALYGQLGDSLDIKVRKDKTEKAMQAYVRINEVMSQLAPQYGIISSSLGSLTEASSFADKLAGQADQFAKAFAAGEFQNALGAAESGLSLVTQGANKLNKDLNLAGINLLKDNDISKAVNALNAVKPENLLPKTLGDMLDKLRK